MGSRASATQQVFRQRAPLALAAVCAVTGVILLLSLVRNWADYPRPVFASWVLFALSVAWSIFVRPAVRLDAEGVTIRNVVRDVQIPWTRLTHAESRWNLRVFTGDRGFTAWAISSQVERPRRAPGAFFGLGSPGPTNMEPGAGAARSTTATKVTALTVARSIGQAKREYDEAVASGRLPVAPDGEVRVTWARLAIVVLLLPALAVLALSLG